MRMRDKPTVAVELSIAAPPARVWELVTDLQLGPRPSGLTARIAELPDREEDIIAARTAELRRNMQTTLAGLKAAAEQGS